MVGSMLPGDPAMNSALGILIVGALLSATARVRQTLVEWLLRFRRSSSGSCVLVFPGDPLHVPLQKALLEKRPEAFVRVRLDTSQGHPEMRMVSSSLKDESFPLRLSDAVTVRVSVCRNPHDLLLDNREGPLVGAKTPSILERLGRWFERLIVLARGFASTEKESSSESCLPSSIKKETLGGEQDQQEPLLAFCSPSLGVCALKEHLVAFSRGSCDANQNLKLFRLTRSNPGKTKRKDSVGEMRWNSQPLVCSKNFANTPMSDGVERALYDDFREFLKSQSAYRLRGLSWKRGYLLHGPPGSGKSSCIRAMAVEGGLDIFLLDMQLIRNNAELALALAQIGGLSNQRPHLLVLEDFDRCSLVTGLAEINGVSEDLGGNVACSQEDPEDELCDVPILGDANSSNSAASRQRHYFSSRGSSKSSSVTLDALLQEMEGIVEHVGRVTVFTANKPGYLQAVDPTGALFRVGRIDRQIRIGLCTRKQVERIVRMYFAAEDPNAASSLPPMTDRFRSKTLSPAQLIDLLRSSLSNVEEACLFLKGEPTNPKLRSYFSDLEPTKLPPKTAKGTSARNGDASCPGAKDDDDDGDDGNVATTRKQRQLDVLTKDIKDAKMIIRKASSQRKKLMEFVIKLQATEEREAAFLESRQDDFLRLQLAMEKLGTKSRVDRGSKHEKHPRPFGLSDS